MAISDACDFSLISIRLNRRVCGKLTLEKHLLSDVQKLHVNGVYYQNSRFRSNYKLI